jgi:hypothetical protein
VIEDDSTRLPDLPAFTSRGLDPPRLFCSDIDAAAKSGDTGKITRLLKRNPALVLPKRAPETPWHLAAFYFRKGHGGGDLGQH